jgi:putative serine protease PepD
VAAPPKQHRGGFSRTWLIAVVAGLVGALAASGIGMVTGAFERQTTVVRSVMPSSPVLSLSTDTPVPDLWSGIDDELVSSVVSITVSNTSGTVTGSGFLYQNGGQTAYVLTDSGLFAGSGTIQVTFSTGEQDKAHLVGTDQVTGLAVLAVPGGQRLYPILSTVSYLQVANPVLAIGSRMTPGGSAFAGLVAAEDQEVAVTGGNVMENMIAISGADLPPAAAGGPLVDQNGRVIGVTVNVEPTENTDQGFTFAVPIDVAEHVTSQLLSKASLTHPWVGLPNMADLSSSVAQGFGLQGGAQIISVSPGSPAARLGLNANDIVTSFNNQSVTSTGTLTHILAGCQPGRPVPITYVHQGRSMQGSVMVVNQPFNS